MNDVGPAGADGADAAARAHSITVCTRCRRTGEHRHPGHALISKLRHAVDSARRRGTLGTPFTVDGVACMAGCDRPCTVAYRAEGKSAYLFGDIDETADIDALIAFAAQYALSDDGWTRSTERPSGLAGKTLARVPCSLVIERQRDAHD